MSRALLLAYYGDDFTGSTDVMEVLSRAGLRTVLFLAPPTVERLAAFPGLRAFGIAGGSRTMSPEAMERELPPVFEALKASGAPIVHYKMCSTFDSSPRVGSVGKAIEVARRVFGDHPTPLVVGAPVLGRYVAFGNLFARSGLDAEPCRLDRHPTMSRHPVTPMDEADIRRLLARQTSLPVRWVDAVGLEAACASTDGSHGVGAEGSPGLDGSRPDSPAPIVGFDTMRDAHLRVIGRELDRMRGEGPLFVVGSSGIEYALVAHWLQGERRRTSWTGAERPGGLPIPPASEGHWVGSGRGATPVPNTGQLVCVSGSCSPVTDRQISLAMDAGFVEVPLHAKDLVRAGYLDAVRTRVLLDVGGSLPGSRGLILHTSRGPGDRRMVRGPKTRAAVSAGLGTALARLLEDLLKRTGIRRAVVCGGDTSMAVARALGIEALEFLAPIAPGCPLCRVHAPGRVAHGCEIAFKGGQVGRDRFFLDALGVAAMERGGREAGTATELQTVSHQSSTRTTNQDR